LVRPALALTSLRRSVLLVWLLAGLLAFAACGGGSGAPAPTATPSPEPTATPDPGPPEIDRARIIEHMRKLSLEIGPRLTGSAEEQEAIDYARGLLEGWGYEVQTQTFPATGDLLRDVSVTPQGAAPIAGVMFSLSATGTVTGPLVDVGPGTSNEYPAANGAVVLVQRGEVRFSEMALRARRAGASALVIANNGPGPFQGGLANQVGLPVVAIGQEEGASLRTLLAAGPVQATVSVSEPRRVTSHNVIARTPGSACRTLSGGHIDSVWWADGANDNASGSAVVLELARVAAASGLSGHCFALFGAEEVGLLGSAFFVSNVSRQDRNALQAYLNFDVVGSNAPPQAIGGQELLDRVGPLADALGLDIELSTKVNDIGSDHRSFVRGGFPVLMLSTGGPIHTPADTLANLDPAYLEPLGRLGLALIQDLAGP